ncbi:helix-turn-helix transcriptional regulator [Candidatus Spongiihabitans sp.]|uniref:helix-turn-helix transcriptional regulator n=1 Tax=Candidatus Spongiihabitans sp. TaxID=3101308 RepID=UPI003C7D6590
MTSKYQIGQSNICQFPVSSAVGASVADDAKDDDEKEANAKDNAEKTTATPVQLARTINPAWTVHRLFGKRHWVSAWVLRLCASEPRFLLHLIDQPPDYVHFVCLVRLALSKHSVADESLKYAAAKHHVLNPLGIVVRGATVYLVATSWDYNDPRHYALHRMSNAALLDKRAKSIAGFDLARHVDEQKEFSYPVLGKKIKLRAVFSKAAALHLTESKLSADQKITRKKEGGVLIEATIADTAELRWWLLGFGSAVEVLGPSSLRKEFAAQSEEIYDIYKH